MRNCLDCGEHLKGRPDKKFCDGYCRSHYNNILNKSKHDSLKKINGILKKNTGILEQLCKNGIHAISPDNLSILGFDFNYFTHLTHSEMGDVYTCCYRYGYHFIKEKELLLAFFSGEG